MPESCWTAERLRREHSRSITTLCTEVCMKCTKTDRAWLTLPTVVKLPSASQDSR